MKIEDLKMTKLKNNIKLKGEKLQVYKIKRQDNKLIKRGDMIKFSEKVLSDLRKKICNGFISLSIKYPKHDHTTGMTNINDGYIKFFSMDDNNNFDEDPLKYSEFTINFML